MSPPPPLTIPRSAPSASAASSGRLPLLEAGFLRRLEELSIVSRKVVTGRSKGERRTPRKGPGLEFVDHRGYAVGDDLRYVDWNIYSRLDRLLLKLFVVEEDLCLHLLIDGSASMGFGRPAKLDYAARVAAALAYIGLGNLERVAVGLFADNLRRHVRPRRGRGQILPLLEFLGALRAAGRTHLNGCLSDYVFRSRTPGVAVILSDFLDPGGYAEGLRALLARRFEVALLHVVSEDELNPDFRGDLTLVDAESGPTREVTVDRAALDAYRERLRRHFGALEAYCARHRIDYLRTSTAVPFDDLILRHMRRGGFLK
ncbi:MAG: DUF58 domain-containing protein [candidate division NC10 bacterium]|nr:DUF58 domain-containing protein [candidate division NC10 bacterium]